MNDQEYEKHDEITEKTLKPITKVSSKKDKELQEWEVESTKDGQDSQGSWFRTYFSIKSFILCFSSVIA